MERDTKRVPFYKLAKMTMSPGSSEEAILQAAQEWGEFVAVAWRIYERLKREGKLEEALASYRRKIKEERSVLISTQI